jgi:hypothetical protein
LGFDLHGILYTTDFFSRLCEITSQLRAFLLEIRVHVLKYVNLAGHFPCISSYFLKSFRQMFL